MVGSGGGHVDGECERCADLGFEERGVGRKRAVHFVRQRNRRSIL